jgi:hypothetical protein
MAEFSIDDLYDGFVGTLPRELRPLARGLPHALKLAPVRTARWSDVFSHAVTLGAPWMVAEAFPSAEPGTVRTATLAHALSVIEAFGSDRVADGQVRETAELARVLAHLREARDGALSRLGFDPGEAALADERTRLAIASERVLLARAVPVDFAEYERISLGKQALGFPGTLALAHASNASPETLVRVATMLEGVWLGLQFEDDVIDWEDDLRASGAWAVCLARKLRSDVASQDLSHVDTARRVVLESGALCGMLERSRRGYRSAWRHALILGAWRLGAWAKVQETRLESLIRLESKHAGYSVRVRKLSTWAVEVLV